MSGQIFISYRREESRWSARSLCDRLTQRFDRNQIFMDVDAIALGEDFLKAIEKRVGECDVLIAVIGAHWLTSTDEQGGRRLDDPEDFVRMEIATALRRDIRVIPVLVDGASMPRSRDLPDDLKSLVRRNALQVGDTHFDDDCRRLVAAIEQVLEITPSPPAITNPSVEEEPRSALERATKDHPWVNSLGMKFVPVAGTQVLFSVWDTRVQDFETFVKSTGYDATGGMYSGRMDGSSVERHGRSRVLARERTIRWWGLVGMTRANSVSGWRNANGAREICLKTGNTGCRRTKNGAPRLD